MRVRPFHAVLRELPAATVARPAAKDRMDSESRAVPGV